MNPILTAPGNPGETTEPWYRAQRFGVLLFSLLAYMAVLAFLSDEGRINWLVHLAFLVPILTSLATVWRSRRWFLAGLALAVLYQAAAGVGDFNDISNLELVGAFFRVAFMGLMTILVARDVMRSPRITLNVVMGACSVYVLMAFMFGSLYSLLEQAQPGAFDLSAFVDPEAGLVTDYEGLLTYFSLITMTTVGFGDITPQTHSARTLAALQGIIGQLFVGVVIARVVAMELAERMNRPPGNDP